MIICSGWGEGERAGGGGSKTHKSGTADCTFGSWGVGVIKCRRVKRTTVQRHTIVQSTLVHSTVAYFNVLLRQVEVIWTKSN